jgi:hypothetical protein
MKKRVDNKRHTNAHQPWPPIRQRGVQSLLLRHFPSICSLVNGLCSGARYDAGAGALAFAAAGFTVKSEERITVSLVI